MKISLRMALLFLIAAVGFAAGFPAGRSTGFSLGSEWALVQAELLAREQGLFLPVRYENGQFRILLKQPRHLYRNAWDLADQYDNGTDREAGYELQPGRETDSADREAPGDPAQWILSAAFDTHPPDVREEHLADGVASCEENIPTFLVWQRCEFRSSYEGKNDQPACRYDWPQLADTQER